MKPNPDLRRKRPVDTVEEGELGPSKGNKQARQIQDRRGGPTPRTIERKPRWPKYDDLHVLGHPY